MLLAACTPKAPARYADNMNVEQIGAGIFLVTGKVYNMMDERSPDCSVARVASGQGFAFINTLEGKVSQRADGWYATYTYHASSSGGEAPPIGTRDRVAGGLRPINEFLASCA